MKLTTQQLRQIIKEELGSVLREQEQLDEGGGAIMGALLGYLFAGGVQTVTIDGVDITKDAFETMAIDDSGTSIFPDSMVKVHQGDVTSGLAEPIKDMDGDEIPDIKTSEWRMGGRIMKDMAKEYAKAKPKSKPVAGDREFTTGPPVSDEAKAKLAAQEKMRQALKNK
jgi:hypothetical protein